MRTPHDDPTIPSGRVTFDDRGDPVWEWRVAGNRYTRDVDTSEVKALQEHVPLALEGRPETAPDAKSADYFVAGPAEAPATQQRRTLDDMRRLSEEIKRRRALKAG